MLRSLKDHLFSWKKSGRIPTLPLHWDREPYIPLHVLDLIHDLTQRAIWRGQDEGQFRLFCRLVLSLLHQQYRKSHQQLTLLYNSLDPDRDQPLDLSDTSDAVQSQVERIVAQFGQTTKRQFETAKMLSPTETSERIRTSAMRVVFDELSHMLERANYRRLSPMQIQMAVGSASHWGVRLRVRFSMFQRLEVYARGDIVGKKTIRRLRNYFRIEEVDVPIYQRLVVLFRARNEQKFDQSIDPRCLHIRMFKNIPKIDIDMLLPGAGVRMTWVDRGKIGLPSIWGFFLMVWKIVKNAWLLALLGAVKVFASVFFVLAVALAVIVYSIKSLFSYTSAKRRYLLNVARNLYYQNLDNNMGAMLRLLDEAEQQEACETILAYFVLSNPTETQPRSMQRVDEECESILTELTKTHVDFDIDDALRDLSGLGVVQIEQDGWTALPLDQAIAKLDECWDKYFVA